MKEAENRTDNPQMVDDGWNMLDIFMRCFSPETFWELYAGDKELHPAFWIYRVSKFVAFGLQHLPKLSLPSLLRCLGLFMCCQMTRTLTTHPRQMDDGCVKRTCRNDHLVRSVRGSRVQICPKAILLQSAVAIG